MKPHQWQFKKLMAYSRKEGSGRRWFWLSAWYRRFCLSVNPSHCHHGCNPQHPGATPQKDGGWLDIFAQGALQQLLLSQKILKVKSSIFLCLLNACSKNPPHLFPIRKKKISFKREFSFCEGFIMTTVNIGDQYRAHDFPRPLQMSCPYQTYKYAYIAGQVKTCCHPQWLSRYTKALNKISSSSFLAF